MSLIVKINGRSPVLPGGGYEISGVASNAKEFVWGEVSGLYTASGVPLTPTSLGLTGSFDFIWFSPVAINNAATSYATDTQVNVNYNEATALMLAQTEDNAGSKTACVTGQAYVANFFACGTSAKQVDLT